MGEEFAFPVNIDQKMDEIVWTKNKDKVVEWEGQNRPTYFTPLQNRGLLNTQNGCLIILNLEKNDTGTYMLEYMDAVKKTHVFHHTFMLSVLDPPSEPETSCNVSGDDLVLRCAADFQRPLTYVWKFSNNSVASQTQELFISKKNVDASEKVACFIQFSQTEKSSEISFTQCFADQKGDSYQGRSRYGLIVTVLLFLGVGIVAFLYKKVVLPRCQKSKDDEQPNSDRAICYQASDDQNERPEADEKLMARDSTPKEKQMVNGVNQEDTFKEEDVSLLASDADVHGVNEAEEVGPGDAEEMRPGAARED